MLTAAGEEGQVDYGSGPTKRTPLKWMRFESLEGAHAYLDRWGQSWTDWSVHDTTPGCGHVRRRKSRSENGEAVGI